MYNDILKIKENNAYVEDVLLEDIAKKFKTPTIVYSQSMLEDNIKLFKENFQSKMFNTEVLFASKAFSCISIYQLINHYNLGIDVVSGGELYTAIKAGFNLGNVYFHGNNKSLEELQMAIENNINCIVIDNIQEIINIQGLLKNKIKVMLRINPGIDAHTHDYIRTSKLESKFGISSYDQKNVTKALNLILSCKNMEFMGFHCHIGSQIFDDKTFYKTLDVMIKYIITVSKEFGITVKWLNVGGGFGISISKEDEPFCLRSTLKNMISTAEYLLIENNISLEKLIIEPGRSIVSEAALTLYTIGEIKETVTNKKYYFIDGGMTDNIRPALYQAKYECDVISKIALPKNEVITIAGKACESSDLLIKDSLVQMANVNDLLVIYSTGAYNYSMASNYNRVLRPAVVFVKDNECKLVIKRETYDDIIKNDLELGVAK